MRSLRVEGASRPVERRGLECTRLHECEKLVLVGVFDAKAGHTPQSELADRTDRASESVVEHLLRGALNPHQGK